MSITEQYAKLTEEQMEAFHRIADHIVNFDSSTHPNPIVLDANGGSGKSFVIRTLSKFLLENRVEHKVTAFTGRACSQISKEGLPSSIVSTMHAMLKEAILDINGDLVRFEDRNPSEVRASVGKGVIVDEGSMVPNEMYKNLMNLNLPIVIVGDNGQLESIEPEVTKGFNAMDIEGVPKYSLTRNFRQESGSGIADLCMHLRENNTIPRKKRDDVKFVLKSQAMKLKFHVDNQYDAIICGTNKTRKKLNDLVRHARGFVDEYPEVGDILICKRNDVVNETRINNGELFVVEGVFPDDVMGVYYVKNIENGKKVTVRVLNETWATEKGSRKYKGVPVQLFTYGYAMTCHAAQGSQFNDLLYIDEDVSFFLNQQKFRYTAVSRAAKQLTISI